MNILKQDSLNIKTTKNQTTGIVISYIILGASFITTLVTLINAFEAPQGYQIMWLLPLLYGILFSCTRVRKAIFRYTGITILNFVLAARYLLIPLYSSLTGVYFHSYASSTYGDANSGAILIMVYEMICIFCVLHITIGLLNRQESIYDNGPLYYDNHYFIYIIVILGGVVSLFIFPSVLERMNVLLVKNFVFNNLDTFASIGYMLTVNVQKMLLLIIILREYKKITKGRKVSFLLISGVALLNIAVFWSTNRLTVVAQSIATILLIKTVIPSKGKLFYTLLGTISILVIFSLSSYRWFGEGELFGFLNASTSRFDAQEITNYLQAYLGGPHLISTAIEAHDRYSSVIGVESFFNEMLGSIMFVRQLPFIGEISTATIFNYYFGFTEENSMILPTLGQSYMYFGTIGAPILSVIFCLLIYYVEKALIECRSIGEKYAYYILVIWLAFFPMQNLNIVMSTIFNVFLPLYLIVVTNNKITLRKKKRKVK